MQTLHKELSPRNCRILQERMQHYVEESFLNSGRSLPLSLMYFSSCSTTCLSMTIMFCAILQCFCWSNVCSTTICITNLGHFHLFCSLLKMLHSCPLNLNPPYNGNNDILLTIPTCLNEIWVNFH